MSRRARRHKPEEHLNHEAWAIPYGDLVTLLLAFFVVMYAISQVNEGKYRVLSDSLSAAFRGTPKTLDPIPVGEHLATGKEENVPIGVVQQALLDGEPRTLFQAVPDVGTPDGAAIRRMAEQVETALGPLIDQELITVRRTAYGIEVDIRADFLFQSGSAELSPAAMPVLGQVAATLRTIPNLLRVEGHTDNVPLRNNRVYPSNWELSAARAASVVHLFTDRGLSARRLSVAAYGEQRPAQSNDTPEGRNANRRVLIVVLGEVAPSAGEVAPLPAAVGTDSAVLPAAPQR